jgi:hypothetical protein
MFKIGEEEFCDKDCGSSEARRKLVGKREESERYKQEIRGD